MAEFKHLIGAKLSDLKKEDGKVKQTKIASMVHELEVNQAITNMQAIALKQAAAIPSSVKIPANIPLSEAATASVPEPPPLEALPQKKDISREEAEFALRRLTRLEDTKPTAGQVGRGALVGSIVGPAAGLASRAITGSKGLGGAPIFPGARGVAAMAGHGAVFGGLLPAINNRIERESEKSKLRKFLGQEEPKGKMRQAWDSVREKV